MEKSNKTWNYNQDKTEKKMIVKFGGGGIGAVVLLGGVLATAALASAFAARRKGRTSAKDRRSFHRNPLPENDELSEQDEANNDTVSLISTEGLTPDVKMINGVSGDGFVIVDEDFPHPENDLSLEYLNIGIIEEDNDVDEERERGLKEEMELRLEREEMMSEKKCLESVVTEDENEERESGLPTQIVEIDAENEEKLVRKQEKCEEKQRNETRCKIEEREENVTIPHEKNNQGNGYIHGIVNEEAEFDAKENVEKEVYVSSVTNGVDEAKDGMNLETSEEGQEEEEKIVEESSLGSGDGIVNEEAEFDAKENVEKEVDVSPEANGIDKAKDGMNLETSEEEEEEEEEEIVEESSLGSGDSSSESNSEAVWPAESAKPKLIDFEVGERNDQAIIEKTFSNKYYTMEMGMKKDRCTNSGRRRVAIATSSLLSSLLFSWFFGLSSFAHLCLVVFLTMFLSEMYCY